ncbi:ABC transporter substrate-binding protein [Colwellia sp. MB02u-14]|nr:ABC transporter substrate-binding protein [Colwellia sp. MB02u-14]MBA6231571.1 ABC transporter substrate-binding protein [Colwellia sp. MB02u-7]MBA6235435.1 ABC transporter substrate-binding protein [Colwellia sp. MB02u-11]MBA6299865.1 ABC transporter substrate-binding protein [Colwellia sp. MB3u-22]MBA6310823.1 ABC transporter substrate-binding protein [Colwellia sp. MB3u-64]MBA6305464.1 ABC transporter substrate-binding protein [Colwellia sp. MB02u-14]
MFLPILCLVSACNVDKDQSLSDHSIVYCSEGSPESFNPQTVTSGTTVDATSNQLYNRLISFRGEDNTIAPSLAKSWHVTRDGKMITFYLRKDVAFHQTDYFTPTRFFNADDVLFSFNRILLPKHPFHQVSGGKYPFFQSVSFSTVVESIEKINDYTIRFKFKYADSSILANIASDFAIILSKEYADTLVLKNIKRDIDTLPIGTGPFKLKEYRPGAYIRFATHKKYWDTPSTLEQLVFDITPSNTSRLTKLLAGECDVIAFPIAHKKIKSKPQLQLEAVTSFNVGYLGFNTLKPPFNDVKVRQAVALAVNKQAIIDTVYRSKADIANSLLPKTSWAYDKNTRPQTYDLSQAKKLIIEAGFPDGFTMNLWALPVQRAYNPDAVTMAKLIQADLKKIGIKVLIENSLDMGSFLEQLSKGEHQSVLLGWSADHPDPDNFFTPLLSCSSAKSGNNRTFWCNEDFDNLIQQALETTNVVQRKQLYSQALAIISTEVPLIPIAHSKRFQARKNIVKGQLLSPFGGIDFSKVSKN